MVSDANGKPGATVRVLERQTDLPANVPPARAFEWMGALAPNSLDDPYSPTEEIVRKCPALFYSPSRNPQVEGPGMWVARGYEAIREIFQNSDHYSSNGVYPFFKLMGEPLRAIPISIDPPEHGKYRMFLNPWFSPKAVTALESKIYELVNQLIDVFETRGECDVAYEFGRVYPVKVFMELMGFPPERFEDFLSWSHPMHFEMDNPERMRWGATSALAYVRQFIEEVRAAPPNATLASIIAHGQIEGQPLTEDEIVGTIFFLWDGGMDTVAATTSLIFRRLALDADLQQTLRQTPELIPEAIEEFLRMNPTVNTVRIAKVDHELEGMQIKAGDRLLCLVAAGNFDPGEFEDPRTFRIDRATNRHLSFIAGGHRCLGSNLARREMKIALAEFFRRIPPFRMRPGAECVAMPGLMGAQSVPLVWEATA